MRALTITLTTAAILTFVSALGCWFAGVWVDTPDLSQQLVATGILLVLVSGFLSVAAYVAAVIGADL